MMPLGPYAPFILGSYAVTILVLGGLVIASLVQYRSAQARLAAMERRAAEDIAP